MRRIVITGAPGTGKTSLVNRLAGTFATIPEPARRVLAEHATATGERSLDSQPEFFVARLIETAIQDFDSADTDVAIFDRGIPDCVAYATAFHIDAGSARQAAATRRYDPLVFVAPPWHEIYINDELRRATFKQVEEFHDHVVTAYGELGYQLTEIPLVSIEDRAAFVLERIGASSG